MPKITSTLQYQTASFLWATCGQLVHGMSVTFVQVQALSHTQKLSTNVRVQTHNFVHQNYSAFSQFLNNQIERIVSVISGLSPSSTGPIKTTTIKLISNKGGAS